MRTIEHTKFNSYLIREDGELVYEAKSYKEMKDYVAKHEIKEKVAVALLQSEWTGDLWNPIRTRLFKSLGIEKEFYLSPDNYIEKLQELKAEGYTLIGVNRDSNSIDISSGPNLLSFYGKPCLVFGYNEKGITEDIQKLCHFNVMAKSANNDLPFLSEMSIILYDLVRKRL